jgi:serine protease Do
LRLFLVSNVSKDSPADKAGLKQGDVVVEFNDRKVENTGQFRNLVSLTPPGSKANLVVIRDGKEIELSAKLGTLEQATIASVTQTDAMEKLGFTVQDLTEDLARQFGYEKHRGVLISQVVPGSENSPGSSGGYFLAPQVVVLLLWGDAHGRQFAHCLVTIFLKVQSELLPVGRNNTVT